MDHYVTAGPFTQLSATQVSLVASLGLDPLGLCRLAQGLLIEPSNAFGTGMSEQRLAERNMRPASALLDRALELDVALSPTMNRSADQRVVGTCRHYAVLAAAFLKASNIAARARCGFASYFLPPKNVDHWIVEFWSTAEGRWVRIDPEWIDRPTPQPVNTTDLKVNEFLTAGEAWQLVRAGKEDPGNFGVFGTQNWGPGEIRGNAMRDLASLVQKVEMLPWDEWGPMADSYNGSTGPDFDRLIDELAAATVAHDTPKMARIYDLLAVPESMIV